MTSCLLVANCAVAPATPQERTKALDELRKTVAQASNAPLDSTLAAFEKRYPKSEAAALARFRRGFDSYNRKEFANSADLLGDPAIREFSRIGAYALYFQGKALFDGGQYDRAERTLGQLPTQYPDFLLNREAQLLAGRAAAARQDFTGIQQELKSLLAQGDGTALLILATAQEQAGRTADATQTYQRLYFEAPHSPECETAKTKLPALGIPLLSLQQNSGKQWQTRAERLFENKQYVSATEAFAQLSALSPEAFRNELTRFQYGVSLYFAQRYKEAVSWLIQASSRRKELHPDALYYQSEAERKAGMVTYLNTAEEFLAMYPKHSRAGEVLTNLAEFQEKRGNGGAYYARLIRDYPETKAADSYSYKRAWALQKSGNIGAAVPLLIQHVGNFPSSDYKGMSTFWAARDLEKLGNSARALTLYEAILKRYRYGYYGHLSNERIRVLKDANPGLKPENPEPKSDLGRAVASIQPARPLPETVGKEADPSLERASDLRVIGVMDLALGELEAARKTAPTSPKINREIARVYRDQGDNLRAVQSLQRAHPDYLSYQGDEVSREEWEIFFPMVEWETIQREAKVNGLDPFIVAGLIRQESVFNPRAVSRANAMGLMQLLPSTGRMVARKNGSGMVSADQLFNPKFNIQLGTIYLSDMYRQFGRYEYAFAAYNGGPGRVSTWLKTLPSEDIATWVEAIPISETRLYVQGVLRNAAHYRRLYGNATRSQTGTE